MDKDKGSVSRKPSVRKRLFGGMKSFLPKVSRARTKSMRLDRKALTEIGRTGASSRNPLPDIPPELQSLVRSDFILYIGKDFTSTLNSNNRASVDLVRDVLKELKKHLTTEHVSQKVDIEEILGRKDGKLEKVIKLYEAVFGPTYFNKIFKQKLIAKFEAQRVLDDTLPYKLIKSLKPLFIIYEDIDLNLENVFEHDNLKSVTYTHFDLISLALVHENPIEELLRIRAEKGVQIILKLNGSISDPKSIALTEYETLARFGIGKTGNFLSKEVLTKDNKILKVLFKDMVTKFPVVVVGQQFLRQTALSTFLHKVRKLLKDAEKEKIKEEGEEEGPKIMNYALVKREKNQRIDGHKLNIEYIEYDTPDKSSYNAQNHVDEFLAYLAGFASKAIPKTIPSNAIFVKSYVQALSAPGFLKGLSKKELSAKLICIFLTDLKQLPFGEDKETEEYMTKFAKKKLASPDHVERFLENVKLRENNFKKLIYPPKKEETAVEVEEIGESKEVEKEKVTEEDLSAVRIKLLITKKSIQQFENLTKSFGIEKVQNLIDFIADSKGKIQLKIVDSEVNDEVGKDFELLFLNDSATNRSGTSDVCLIQQSFRKHFSINWFEANTNETEEKVMFFDRMWTTAIGQREGLDTLAKAVEKAKASVKKAEELKVQNTSKGKSKSKSKAAKEKSKMRRKNSKNKTASKSKKEVKKKDVKKKETKKKDTKKKDGKKAEAKKKEDVTKVVKEEEKEENAKETAEKKE